LGQGFSLATKTPHILPLLIPHVSKKILQQKNKQKKMFSTLTPCFPSSPIPLSNKKHATFAQKNAIIYITSHSSHNTMLKKIMCLNAMFYLLTTQVPLFI